MDTSPLHIIDMSSIVANTTSLKYRPIYQGIFGGVECTALAFGPLISGAIAHGSSWRISFYIIIPVAVCNIVAIGIFVRNLPQPKHAHLDGKSRFQQLDTIGILLFVPMNICLIFALQWGGTVYPWDDGRIIALLVLAGAFAIAFGFAEQYQGDKAMFPLHLLRQRTMILGVIYQFCVSASLFVFGFYVSLHSTISVPVEAYPFAASNLFPSHPWCFNFGIRPNVLANCSCFCSSHLCCW